MSIKQGGNTIAGSGVDAYTKAETDAKLLPKQDKLTAVNYDNITNCITEIPQDIKLELNNGTLTLKAGSKVYVPNGAGVFDEITIASDLATGNQDWSSGKGILYYRTDTNAIATYPLDNTESGSSSTLTYTYRFWYDTINNVIKITSNSGSTWEQRGTSLPIAIVHWNKDTYDVVDSIDQIFNGFGYIGSTVFALPGVKGLIPNGRNADGTLKNIEFTVSNVLTETGTSGNDDIYVVINSSGLYRKTKITYIYNEKENLNIYNGAKDSTTPICWHSRTSGVISNFTPKTSFHVVDYNDFSGMVTTDTAQTISGAKTLLAKLTLGNSTGHMGEIELFGGNSNYGGYIDFHYGNSTSDYTSRIIENSSGNINLDCTSVTAPATTKTNGVVTQTLLSKATNGYVKLGNGLLIQWGQNSSFTSRNPTITLNKAYSSATSYVVVGSGTYGNTSSNGWSYTTSRTTTNFKAIVDTDMKPWIWIAIGY